jgi:sterol desaturase/sphingolipid hydroxylase (fatty acid hydroxylase superfamily)
MPTIPTEALSALAIAFFLALVANRLIEALIVPIFDRQQWDKFWLLYIAWVIGGIVVAFSGVNLFATYIPAPAIGQILTAIVAGGGANFLADLFNDRQGNDSVAAG